MQDAGLPVGSVDPQLAGKHAGMIGPPGWQVEPFTQLGQVGSGQVGVHHLTPRLHHPALSLGVLQFVDLFAGVEHKDRVAADLADGVWGRVHR